MKLTEKQKKEIYQKRKNGKTVSSLSEEYEVNKSRINYLIRLIDAHGLESTKHCSHHYASEFKLTAINRVLINDESITSVSIDLGLSDKGTLTRWIKEFEEKSKNAKSEYENLWNGTSHDEIYNVDIHIWRKPGMGNSLQTIVGNKISIMTATSSYLNTLLLKGVITTEELKDMIELVIDTHKNK